MGGVLTWIKRTIGMAHEEEECKFPDTLEDFGYRFNQEGKLRSIEKDEPYDFHVSEDFHYNQKYYNAIGDVITEEIYQMMINDYKLRKVSLPRDAEEGEPTSFVFISEDFSSNRDKLLVLIHGSGAVRAGQWARRLIINDSLDSGSQLPYIKWGQENGYAIIVANTNLNSVRNKDTNKKPVKIRGNGSPEEHTESLWKEYVAAESEAEHIAIVAHSYGGVCTLELAKNHIREFQERVFAVALTDSVHGLRQQEAEAEVKDFYKLHVINWASAYDPLDTPLKTSTEDCPTVSAGTDKHEETSFYSMHSIFKYFTKKYEMKVHPSSDSASSCSPVSREDEKLDARGTGEGQEEELFVSTEIRDSGDDIKADIHAEAGADTDDVDLLNLADTDSDKANDNDEPLLDIKPDKVEGAGKGLEEKESGEGKCGDEEDDSLIDLSDEKTKDKSEL